MAVSLMHRNQRRESSKMKKLKNMLQTKEQHKTSEKILNETDNLSDKELKIQIRVERS